MNQLLCVFNINTKGIKITKDDKRVFGKENVELFRKHKTRFMKVQKWMTAKIEDLDVHVVQMNGRTYYKLVRAH